VHNDPMVAELVVRAGDGDGDAWVQLVNRYAPLVWSICRQFRLRADESEDIGQTVWLGLLEALPRLREPAALPGWLATTTRRECIRHVEAARRRNGHEHNIEIDVADDRLAPVEQGVVTAELEAAMRVAFSQLKPHCQRLLVLLMQSPRLPYAEIAARLQMPIGSIGPQRARCLERLRQCPALAAWIDAQAGPGNRKGGG
jgi:RNA polymerase sigma factor (sigma-70 family)